MIERLLLLFPEVEGAWPGWVLALLAVAGLLLWAVGGRFSRPIVALSAAALGALAGKQVPGWFNLQLDWLACLAVGGLVAGVLGFLLHRYLIALALGGLSALWAAAVVWMLAERPHRWDWPALGGTADLLPTLRGIHEALGADLTQQVIGISLLAGISAASLAILFPRAAMTLLWSIVGVTLLTVAALASGFYLRLPIPWMEAGGWEPLAVLAAAALVGWAIQGILLARRGHAQATTDAPVAPPARAVA